MTYRNKTKTIFVTFGAGRTGWKQASRRLVGEAKKTQLFSSVFNLNENWLEQNDPKIYEIVKKFHRNGFYRGFGYWVWKPAVLHWVKENNPNCNVLYMDAGSHLDQRPDHIAKLGNLLEKKGKNGLAWHLPHNNDVAWTKKELIIRLNPSKIILNSPQVQSGFIYLPWINTPQNFTTTFRQFALEKDGFFFSDELCVDQDAAFVEHRHDQSVFSILWKLNGMYSKSDKTYPENINNFPIIAARNNTLVKATSSKNLIYLIKHLNAALDKVLQRN